jgi:molecular chaperone GrpE
MTQPQTNPDNRIDLSDAGDELDQFESLEETTMADQHDAKPPTEDVVEIEMSIEAAQYVEQLRLQLEEALAARQRALADFRNYQRRALENEQQALTSGSRSVISALLPVLDHFDLALNQDVEAMSVAELLNGVKIVRDEIGSVIQRQGIEIITPEVGDEFDPNRHEAMMRQAAEGIEPNHIVMVMQAGYVMGDVVLRPAKVAVAPSDEDE